LLADGVAGGTAYAIDYDSGDGVSPNPTYSNLIAGSAAIALGALFSSDLDGSSSSSNRKLLTQPFNGRRF
jgi:hypothetical protein